MRDMSNKSAKARMSKATDALEYIKNSIASGKTVYVTAGHRTTKVTPQAYAKWEASGKPLFKISSDGALLMASGSSYVRLTLADEMLARVTAMSRPGANAKFGENVTYSVAVHIGDQPAGERSTKSLEEAKAYAKAMLQTAKANAKGKPIVVDVYPVVNYEPKAAVLTLRASRPGAKAEMGMRDTKGRGPFTLQYIASGLYGEPTWLLVDKANKVVAKEHNEQSAKEMLRKANAGEPVYVSSRPGAKVTAGRAEDLYRQLSSGSITYANAKQWERLVIEALRLPDYTPPGGDMSLHEIAEDLGGDLMALKTHSGPVRASRPGAKAKMGKRDAVEDVTNALAIAKRKIDAMMQTAQKGELSVVKKEINYLRGVSDAMTQRIEKFESTGFSRPGAKARFANEEAQMRELMGQLGQKPDKVIYKYGAFEMHFYGRAGKGDGEQRARRTLANLHAFMRRTGLDTHGAYYQPIDDRDPSQGGMIVLLASTFDKFSRPGAKAKMQNAQWMQHVSNMLRDLTNERQRVQVWIAGPTTVKVAGMWMAYTRYGKGAAIASRMAYYLTQAAGTPGKYSGQDIKDSPRKGTNTTIWTVSNVPEDAVSYLKAWGIGTSPKAFAGFTGESAVAYDRPGAKAKMGFVGTAGQAGAIAARGMRDGAAAYRDGKPAVLNRLDPKYYGWSDKDLKVYGNFWMRGWTGEQMKEMRTRDSKQGIDLPGFRASRPGAKAKNALYMIEIVEGGRVTSTITPDQFRDFAVKNVPGVSRNDFVPTMMEKWNDYAEEHGFGARVRIGGKSKNALSDACWSGYEAVGTKQKDGKTVPNCVPKANAAKPSDLEREDVKAGLKLMEKADKAVSDKIRTLIAEGKPQDQAVAIALDMKRRGEI